MNPLLRSRCNNILVKLQNWLFIPATLLCKYTPNHYNNHHYISARLISGNARDPIQLVCIKLNPLKWHHGLSTEYSISYRDLYMFLYTVVPVLYAYCVDIYTKGLSESMSLYAHTHTSTVPIKTDFEKRQARLQEDSRYCSVNSTPWVEFKPHGAVFTLPSVELTLWNSQCICKYYIIRQCCYSPNTENPPRFDLHLHFNLSLCSLLSIDGNNWNWF